MINWMKTAVMNEESPEARLLQQRMLKLGLLLVLAAAIGMLPVYNDWSVPVENAIVVAVIGFVLIVLDLVQTWMGLKVTGQNEPVTVPDSTTEAVASGTS